MNLLLVLCIEPLFYFQILINVFLKLNYFILFFNYIVSLLFLFFSYFYYIFIILDISGMNLIFSF